MAHLRPIGEDSALLLKRTLAVLCLLLAAACAPRSSGSGTPTGDPGAPEDPSDPGDPDDPPEDPPTDPTHPVAIEAPADGAVLLGTTVVSAVVDATASIVSVQLRLDGLDLGPQLLQAPWRFEWDTSTASDGAHELVAVAVDADQAVWESDPVAFVIDNASFQPKLGFSTFLGHFDKESVRDVFVDGFGYVYVTGGTESPQFPTTPGAFDETYNGTHDVYVTQLTPDGKDVVFSTFLGGANYDRAYAIEVDADGYVYVAGRAGDGFPTTPGAVQELFGGDSNPSPLYGPQDGFVAKLEPDGSALVWCTYFGSDDGYSIRDLDVDADGNVYVASAAQRPHWAVTAGAFDTVLTGPQDGLVAVIAADGASVVWGSYYGEDGVDGGTPSIRAGDDGTVWILSDSLSDDFPVTPGAYQETFAGGMDMVVLCVEPGGAALRWSTYFGGSDVEFSETHGLWVEPDGTVTIAATTLSPDLPFAGGPDAPPFQPAYGGTGGSGTGSGTNYNGDGFVAKLAADGSALLAFTYLGGSDGEGLEGVAVDSLGRVHVAGATFSLDFPVTASALQPDLSDADDSFLARFSADLATLEFASFFGDAGEDLGRTTALGPDDRIVVAGTTDSTGFPTTAGAFQESYGGGSTDGFVFEVIR